MKQKLQLWSKLFPNFLFTGQRIFRKRWRKFIFSGRMWSAPVSVSLTVLRCYREPRCVDATLKFDWQASLKIKIVFTFSDEPCTAIECLYTDFSELPRETNMVYHLLSLEFSFVAKQNAKNSSHDQIHDILSQWSSLEIGLAVIKAAPYAKRPPSDVCLRLKVRTTTQPTQNRPACIFSAIQSLSVFWAQLTQHTLLLLLLITVLM